jgi:hypothetical protein
MFFFVIDDDSAGSTPAPGGNTSGRIFSPVTTVDTYDPFTGQITPSYTAILIHINKSSIVNAYNYIHIQIYI